MLSAFTADKTGLLTGSIVMLEATIQVEHEIADLAGLDRAPGTLAAIEAKVPCGKGAEAFVVSGSSRQESLCAGRQRARSRRCSASSSVSSFFAKQNRTTRFSNGCR